MVPLAIGLNFDFFGLYGSLNPELYWGGMQAAWWGPMAVAIIAGILFATFLTLILVPVMYSLVDDATEFFRRHYVLDEGEEGGAGVGLDDAALDAPIRGRASIPASVMPEPEPVGSRRQSMGPGGLLDPQPKPS
jgi:hypothetical protein